MLAVTLLAEASHDTSSMILVEVLVYLIGPFWIFFKGGADTLLGGLWLLTDVILVRSACVTLARRLELTSGWKLYGEYLWGCIPPLALATWLLLNGLLMALWFYFCRS